MKKVAFFACARRSNEVTYALRILNYVTPIDGEAYVQS